MEFKIEVARYQDTKEIQVNIVNKPDEFCCGFMFDLYQMSYKEGPPDVPIYGGIDIVSSQQLVNRSDGESQANLAFVFEDGKKRDRLAYPIYFCPFCGESIAVREIQIQVPSLNNEERKGD